MRKPKSKLSPLLHEMVNEPTALDNPSDKAEIDEWNAFLEEYQALDEFDQLGRQPELRVMAGRALYAGQDPHAVPLYDMLYILQQEASVEDYGPSDEQLRQRFLDRVRGPLTAIRGYCVTKCMNGQPGMVRSCDSVSCPFWPFRMGRNPFFGKIADAEAAVVEEPETEEAA